jgi:hypothetical protein
MIQNVIAIAIVCLAAAYLARRAWLRFVRGEGKCDTCPSCGDSDTIKSRPLVSLSLDESHAEAQGSQRG